MTYNETWSFLDESMGIITSIEDILSYLPDEESGADVWTDGEVVYAKTEEELCAVFDWLEDIMKAYGMDEDYLNCSHGSRSKRQICYWSVCFRKEI